MQIYAERRGELFRAYTALLEKPNSRLPSTNGIYSRYQNPVLSAAHVPLSWRFDYREDSNPYFMERIGVNAVFNAGAIYWRGKYVLMPRIESVDRKSFFAIAESSNPTECFRFKGLPILVDELECPDTNIYDMRLTAHEDGWIYGLFCTERRDQTAGPEDQSSAIAQCGIIRSRDLEEWERLPDLQTSDNQQRNVVLHPEFVNGKYALYTRPQDGFIDTGRGGGIGWGLCDRMDHSVVEEQRLMDPRVYHTISESKNGLGPPPLKTKKGWLHLAHGVRQTAAGLRYVLYVFLCSLEEPWKIISKPGGYFMAPEGEERVGDVSNVLFSNGWILAENGKVYLYYASSDTRLHVAESSLNQLLDYVTQTPSDGLTSFKSTHQRIQLIQANMEYGCD